DNVMLSKDGRVVVTDFGIARAFVDIGSGLSNTMGVLMGTPAYMAPEQVEGREIDVRADIYAFGALLYELLTGQRAWQGDSPIAVAAQRLTSPPPDPRRWRPDLPSACAELVVRCMARRPEERFSATEDLVAELAAITAPPAPISRRSAYPPPRSLTPHAMRSPLAPASIPPGADRLLVEALPGDKTVAVLPFRNAGPGEDEYLAE